MSINVTGCLIYDALCCIEAIHSDYYELHKQDMFKEQKEILERIRLLLDEANIMIQGSSLGDSNICYIISQYLTQKDVTKLGLDDLIDVFQQPKKIREEVRKKIAPNSFLASYIYPNLDMLVEGRVEYYISMCKALKEVRFEDIWSKEIYKLMNHHVENITNEINQYDIKMILKEIQEMKGGEDTKDFTAYLSFLSYPNGFILKDGFLMCIDNDGFKGNKFLSFTIHELMHGFSKKELNKCYENLVKQDGFLHQTHKTLIEKMHSGDEEEFVIAAEYFLSWRQGLYNKEELIDIAYRRYRHCLPLSVIIFDQLCKTMHSLENYNMWLLGKFKEGIFKVNKIESQVNEIIPSYSEAYYKYWNKDEK